MRVAIVLLFAWRVAAGEVSGTVKFEGDPLPGCTVSLTSPQVARVVYSNEKGEYAFRDVPDGPYQLQFKMEGFSPAEREVEVSDRTVVPPQAIQSGMSVCISDAPTCADTDDAPETKFDLPRCADEALDLSLIESLARGDRSAHTLLKRRYSAAETYAERHRIAAALVEHHLLERAMWDELADDASLALRFPRNDDGGASAEFKTYCEQRDVDPSDLWYMSVEALSAISADTRARPLLLEAMKSGDYALIETAIAGLALQHDLSALQPIDEALATLGDQASSAAVLLALFKTAEADAIAFKYIAEEEREGYRAWQEPPVDDPLNDSR